MSQGPRVPGGNPADPFPIVNSALDVYQHQEVFAPDPTEPDLLAYAYLGGWWGGIQIVASAEALTDDAENYIVVDRATGALSVAADDTTDWNNLAAYARVMHITTLDGARSVVRDMRAGPGGVHGQADAASAAAALLVSETTGNRDFTTDDAGKYVRFTDTGAKTGDFDAAEGFQAPQEYHIANRAASGNLTLSGTGVTLNPPKGGSLVLEPGDTVTVKFVAADEADVFGSTEAA